MLLVGLTGGIGSGKSTAARMLAARGAVVIDADALARKAVEPGTPAHAAVIEAFGAGVVAPDGSLDRRALAAVVFADEARRRELETIVHPEVRRLFLEAVERHRDTGAVIVCDSPLIVEIGLKDAFDVLVVVTAPSDVQIERLVERGMTEDDVRARMAAQLPPDEKAELADVILDNEGTEEELEGQVERLWRHLDARARPGEA